MSNTAQETIAQILQGIDTGDIDQVMAAYTEDAAGIDEISRGWMRGRDQIADYTANLLAELSDCTSQLTDVHEAVIGDMAVVTAVLTQNYVWSGEAQSVEMPATFVLRREDGEWRVMLFHALPIPT